MWLKKHKWKIILPLLVLALLAGAFFFGGKAPAANSEEEIETEENSAVTDALADAQETVEEEILDETAEEETQVQEESKAEEKTETTEDGFLVTESGMLIDPETNKDKYLTDPVPEGKPIPVEPQDVTIGTNAYTCTLSISCATILNNMQLCDPAKTDLVPVDGWILESITVTFYEGESVFNVLQRVCKQQQIHMEFENTPIYNSAYIEGIHNLYEFDVGELSGWMYEVNGWFPNYGCSRYALKDGDVINWVYTCNLGKDVGGAYAVGG